MPYTPPTTSSKMSPPQVNGDSPSSAFLSHLTSIPVISDSITTFKSNPYGSRSLSLTQTTYNRFFTPLVPYLHTPYAYISPYIARADTLGDSTLSSLESRFPVVKKPTGELYADGKNILGFPVAKGLEGKDYVLKTWTGEAKKSEGQGVVGLGKAVVGTGLVVGGDAYSFLAAFLGRKKTEAKEISNEKLSN